MEDLLQRAIDVWNREASPAIALHYAGLSAVNQPVRVTALCDTVGNWAGRVQNPGDATACGNGKHLELNLTSNYDGAYSTNTSRTTGTRDAQSMLTHEIGHVLGLAHPHWCQIALGCCGLVDSCGTPGYFGDSAVGGAPYSAVSPGQPNQSRHLWEWEVRALRHTTSVGGRFRARHGCTPTHPNPDCCNTVDTPLTANRPPNRAAGYGTFAERGIRFKWSLHDSEPRAWTSGSDNNDTSNAAPSAAFGRADYTGDSAVPAWCNWSPSDCPQYVVAFASTSTSSSSIWASRLYTRVFSGITWGGTGLGGPVSCGARSNVRPALSFGEPSAVKVWLMVHQAADNSRWLYQQTSDDGVHWSTPQSILAGGSHVSTHVAPALSFSSTAGRFVLAWSDRSDDTLHTATLDRPDLGASWAGHQTTTIRAQSGLDIACEGSSSECLLVYNHERTVGAGPGAEQKWWWRRLQISVAGDSASPVGSVYYKEECRGDMGLAWAYGLPHRFVIALQRGAASVNRRLSSRDKWNAVASGATFNELLLADSIQQGVAVAFDSDAWEFGAFFLSDLQ